MAVHSAPAHHQQVGIVECAKQVFWSCAAGLFSGSASCDGLATWPCGLHKPLEGHDKREREREREKLGRDRERESRKVFHFLIKILPNSQKVTRASFLIERMLQSGVRSATHG